MCAGGFALLSDCRGERKATVERVEIEYIPQNMILGAHHLQLGPPLIVHYLQMINIQRAAITP